MTNNQTHFSGLLNQHELSQRLQFIRHRIANGYTTDEVAFLLGRTPHYLKDYEELGPIKLDGEDTINYTYLFTEPLCHTDRFDTKNNSIDISYEKRMLRGQKIWSAIDIRHEYVHPWTWKGLCKAIVLTEPVKPAYSNFEVDEMEDILSFLSKGNYFEVLSSPIEIYKKVVCTYEPAAKMILPLRNALYRLVHAQQLQVQQHFDKFYFKTN